MKNNATRQRLVCDSCIRRKNPNIYVNKIVFSFFRKKRENNREYVMNIFTYLAFILYIRPAS